MCRIPNLIAKISEETDVPRVVWLKGIFGKFQLENVTRLVGFVLIAISAGPVFGQGLRDVVVDLVRGTARVVDDVPAKKIDELIADLSKSRAVRETVDTELRKSGRLAEGSLVIRGAARSDEVLRLLRDATNELDPSLLQRIKGVDESSREALLVLAKGGRELQQTVPDLAARARLLREGGVETVAAVGMFGPEAAKSALRLDEAIRGGSLIVKDGTRAVSVSDFGKVMTRFGDASWSFWNKYVQPHWKVWVASGALAAYLANPDYFHDAAGNITKEGFKRLTEFVGEVSAAAICGIGEGSGSAVKRVVDTFWNTYFVGHRRAYAILGSLAFVITVSLMFRRVRYWVRLLFGWLNRAVKVSKSSRP
jgi:hypothetical protein